MLEFVFLAIGIVLDIPILISFVLWIRHFLTGGHWLMRRTGGYR